eukprot:5633-Heterococcus_DN1.PRE.2
MVVSLFAVLAIDLERFIPYVALHPNDKRAESNCKEKSNSSVQITARFSSRVISAPRCLLRARLFYSFFKTLVGKEVCVELKNEVSLTGVLHSVDQYLNVKLTGVKVVDSERYPQFADMKGCFIRGSVVRYIQIPSSEVDTELLQDACRKENAASGGR